MKNGPRHVIITKISRQLVIIEHRKQFVGKVLLVLLKFRAKETDHFQDTWFLTTFPSLLSRPFIKNLWSKSVHVHLQEARGFVQ